MSLTSGFFNSVNNDRLYDAEQMSAIFDGLINDGIYDTIGTGFKVTPASELTVNVGVGRAWLNHCWISNDTVYPITLDAASASLGRIDTICLKVDHSLGVRSCSIVVLNGVAGSSPVAPDVPADDTENGVYYHPIADISVAAGTTAITPSMITNRVGLSTGTPYVTGIISATTLDQLWAQLEGQFMDWWDTIRAVLDGDIVLRLQNEIDHITPTESTMNLYGFSHINPPPTGMEYKAYSVDALFDKTHTIIANPEERARPYDIVRTYNWDYYESHPKFWKKADGAVDMHMNYDPLYTRSVATEQIYPSTVWGHSAPAPESIRSDFNTSYIIDVSPDFAKALIAFYLNNNNTYTTIFVLYNYKTGEIEYQSGEVRLPYYVSYFQPIINGQQILLFYGNISSSNNIDIRAIYSSDYGRTWSAKLTTSTALGSYYSLNILINGSAILFDNGVAFISLAYGSGTSSDGYQRLLKKIQLTCTSTNVTFNGLISTNVTDKIWTNAGSGDWTSDIYASVHKISSTSYLEIIGYKVGTKAIRLIAFVWDIATPQTCVSKSVIFSHDYSSSSTSTAVKSCTFSNGYDETSQRWFVQVKYILGSSSDTTYKYKRWTLKLDTTPYLFAESNNTPPTYISNHFGDRMYSDNNIYSLTRGSDNKITSKAQIISPVDGIYSGKIPETWFDTSFLGSIYPEEDHANVKAFCERTAISGHQNSNTSKYYAVFGTIPNIENISDSQTYINVRGLLPES